MDFKKINDELREAEPLKIIEWAVTNGKKPITTTNFGPYEAVILHMVTQVKTDMPIIWIDSGYNTPETYTFAEELIERLKLNVDVYAPKVTAARREAALGGIPDIDSDAHDEFTMQFKLEPFNRAMSEQQPGTWFTAVRSEQTAFRQSMEVIGTGPNDVLKIAPVLHWKEQDMKNYLKQNNLPNIENYFDPTKALGNRECGLHTKL